MWFNIEEFMSKAISIIFVAAIATCNVYVADWILRQLSTYPLDSPVLFFFFILLLNMSAFLLIDVIKKALLQKK